MILHNNFGIYFYVDCRGLADFKDVKEGERRKIVKFLWNFFFNAADGSWWDIEDFFFVVAGAGRWNVLKHFHLISS